jgi:hypothetical protein
MIVPQKPAQPVATSDWLAVACFADPMEQQQVVFTLVISLCMRRFFKPIEPTQPRPPQAGLSRCRARGRDAMKAPSS